MRFCIYGAGAIGGYVAVKLARTGHEDCVIVRGTHLAATLGATTRHAIRHATPKHEDSP